MVRAVRRSPPNTPEKRKTLETLQQFEALWNAIKQISDDQFALTLREAANVIGFALFPVGWIWDEYPCARGQALTDIERKAQELGLLGIPDGATSKNNMSGAVKAIRAGTSFRRNAVEKLLRRLIYRGEIRVIVTDSTGRRRHLPDQVRFDRTLSLNVRRNEISVGHERKRVTWEFETDGIDLTKALEGRCAWKNKKVSQNDWFKLERFLRTQFEANGVPRTHDAYVTAAAEWWARETQTCDEPPISLLRVRLSRTLGVVPRA